jgi:hypothetical protein
MLRRLTGILLNVLLLAACRGEVAPPTATPVPTALAAAPVGFVNRVWRVDRSSGVERDMLYVFLSGGTLVMASPHGKPAFGTWKAERGKLTMVEEGLPYEVDILKLDADGFTIRSNNPGEAVTIEMVPAPSAAVERR